MEPKLYHRLCEVIEDNILPLTNQMTQIGCKVFGAAILLKRDLSLVLASTNHESFSPLWHGEIYCIKQFLKSKGIPNQKIAYF